MAKSHDLCVANGEYQKDGETKTRWLNVGCVLTNDNGNMSILLEPWFNLAGMPKDDQGRAPLINMFEVRDKQSSSQDDPPF